MKNDNAKLKTGFRGAEQSIIFTFYFFIFTFLCFPVVAFGSEFRFDHDLYFGMANDSDVTRLQELLHDQKVYDGPVTGNFFTLTREGVKRFQEREGITPTAGYFGLKTRARANELLPSGKPLVLSDFVNEAILSGKILSSSDLATLPRETKISYLTVQIRTLESRLRELQAAFVPATPEAVVVSETVATTTEGSIVTEDRPVAAPKATTIIVSGSATSSFPVTKVSPLKLGDITVENNTGSSVLLAQFRVKITDNMNSSLNRNRQAYFILRDGTELTATQVSRTPFTFNSTVPVNEPHVSLTGFSYPETYAARATRTFGLWIEDLEYVISGTLEVALTGVESTAPVAATGTFRFLLGNGS